MGYNAKDLKEQGLNPAENHASDTGCMACELAYRRQADAAQDALKVIILTDHIREYLQRYDPKALAQAVAAANIGSTRCLDCLTPFTPDERACSPFAFLCRKCDR